MDILLVQVEENFRQTRHSLKSNQLTYTGRPEARNWKRGPLQQIQDEWLSMWYNKHDEWGELKWNPEPADCKTSGFTAINLMNQTTDYFKFTFSSIGNNISVNLPGSSFSSMPELMAASSSLAYLFTWWGREAAKSLNSYSCAIT